MLNFLKFTQIFQTVAKSTTVLGVCGEGNNTISHYLACAITVYCWYSNMGTMQKRSTYLTVHPKVRNQRTVSLVGHRRAVYSDRFFIGLHNNINALQWAPLNSASKYGEEIWYN